MGKKDEATASGGRLVFAGSEVMCRVKRGTLRSGELEKTTANMYKGRRFLFKGRFKIMIHNVKRVLKISCLRKLCYVFYVENKTFCIFAAD